MPGRCPVTPRESGDQPITASERMGMDGRYAKIAEALEEIIVKAAYAGFSQTEVTWNFERDFFPLIDAEVAAEREAAAQLAELDSVLDWVGGSTGNAKGTAMRIAAAIRART